MKQEQIIERMKQMAERMKAARAKQVAEGKVVKANPIMKHSEIMQKMKERMEQMRAQKSTLNDKKDE